jgi:hypothetical protein
MNNDLAGGVAEDLPEAFIEVEFMRREVESSSLRFPRIDFLLERNGCHKSWSSFAGPMAKKSDFGQTHEV